MADTILTIKQNTKKLLKMAAADLADGSHFFQNTEKLEESAFKPDANGYNPGDNVSVRIPTEWSVVEDNFDITSSIADAKETSVSAALDMSATVPFDLDTAQLTTDIDVGAVYERFIRPAVLSLGTNMEMRFQRKAAQYTGNLVGTAGSTTVDPDTVMAAGEKLDEFLAPMTERSFLMDSAAMRSAVNTNKNLFTFKRKEYDDAYIGNALGMDWFKEQLIYRHTNGNDVTGVAVEVSVAATSEGMTALGIDGLTNTTGTLTKGTVFTIDGVYAVHPKTKQTLGFLKQFTHVGSDITANGSGQGTITLNQPIYSSSSGSLQNVSALPADEAAITIIGSASTTYKQSLVWHKKAFRVATVPLVMPRNAELAEQVNENGMNIALIKDFDVMKRRWVTRLDVLGMVIPVRVDHACRVTN